MPIGGNYGPPSIDFTPLGNLGDFIVKKIEDQNNTAEMAAYAAAAMGGRTPLASLADPAASTTAPTAAPPAAPPNIGAQAFAANSRAKTMPGDPETERKFLAEIDAGGLTNPYGKAALAAHVSGESGFDPANFTRTWSDPSQSGQPGTSGGALSWRGDRLAQMKQATQGQDPVTAQAKYALVENPAVTLALQKSKSLEEANAIMARSQRYAGYDQPGGAENTKRLALAQGYLPKVSGSQSSDVLQGGTESAPAPAAPAAAATARPGVSPETQARILGGLRSSSPGVRALAAKELQEITAPKNPMSLGNGILYDPRTGQVQDFSDRATKPPDEYRKFQYEQKDPAFAARQREKEAQAAPKGPGSKFTETTEKHYADDFIDMQKQGAQASSNIGNLQAMRALVDHPDFYSGPGVGLVTSFKRAAGALGIGDVKGAQVNEVFSKMTKRALIDSQKDGKMGAGFSNADRDFVEAAGANPAISPAGNRAIIDMTIRSEERKKEIARRARDYKVKHGTVDEGFDAELADWAEANPAFKGLDPAVFGPPAAAPTGAPRLPPGMPPPGTPATGNKTSKGVTWSVQ